MARENVMSTPIFDQLLREMAQRAEPRPAPPQQDGPQTQDVENTQRRRHRAE